MSNDDPAPVTQTSRVEPSKEQKELMGLAMPGIRQFAATTPQRYQGSTVANFDPSQVAGQEMTLQAAGQQANVANAAADQMPFYFNDIWKPESNPALQGAVDAAVRPITQQLTESTLPLIRNDFSMGNFGASRQGIAEGLASGRASQAVGDTASKVVNDNYKTNIDAQLKAYGLLPTVQQAVAQPGLTTSAVGDVRQAHDQAVLNENASNFTYDQLAPFLQSQEIMSLLNGLPGATTVNTASSPTPAGTGQKLLGGAAAGAGLGAAMFPGVGAIPGAAAGALLPFLFQ